MKICVLGIDGASPEVISTDERLVNLRRLMDLGVYGRLKSPELPDTLRLWMCMGTSQAPESAQHNAVAIWQLLASPDTRSALIGLTSDFAPHEIQGISFACFPASPSALELLPAMTESPEVAESDFPALIQQIQVASRKRWQAARALFSQQRWAYFQVVDTALQAFAKTEAPDAQVISNYYLWFDEQVGCFLELLDDETLLLVLSPRSTNIVAGAQVPQAGDGMFVLIAPNCPLTGEYEGATLIDIAPTLLELAGHPTPSTMQGKSLVAQMQKKSGDGGAGDDEESLIRDRLAGLGYI